MTRQIVLDTETTGLEPKNGHRIIEIGCVELINRRITGKTYHQYINPERDIESAAEQVHGLSSDFLKDKPVFADIIEAFIDFVADAELIIHNAPFDVGFINHEFKLLNKKSKLLEKYCTIVDTLKMARELHPGQRNSLDALCKRYNVDNSNRDLHGGLLDAELLALTYLAMTSGQDSLFSGVETMANFNTKENIVNNEDNNSRQRKLKVIHANEEELAAHEKYLANMEKSSDNVLWNNAK